MGFGFGPVMNGDEWDADDAVRGDVEEALEEFARLGAEGFGAGAGEPFEIVANAFALAGRELAAECSYVALDVLRFIGIEFFDGFARFDAGFFDAHP